MVASGAAPAGAPPVVAPAPACSAARGAPGLGARPGRARRAGTAPAGTVVRAAATATAATRVTRRGVERGLALGLALAADHVALVDPDLHADAAEVGPGLEQAVVDLRAQRVQRHAPLAVELGARHLGATEPAGALHPDALHAGAAHGRLHGLAHRAAERHTVGQLLGDALRDELRVGLGALDLEDVQLDLLAGQLLEVAAQAVGLGAAAPDDDARTRGVDVDADAVTRALDLDLGDAGPLHALGEHAADLDVLGHVVGVLLVGVPARLPVGGDTEAEAVRVDLLAHQRPLLFERARPPFAAATSVTST